MAKIKAIEASEILNAKGFPTIEVIVTLDNGKIGKASCPSGENISKHECLNLKDNDQNHFEGEGVSKAIAIIKEKITPQLIGREVEQQAEIDKTMIRLDGTENKSKLGANSTLAVSMAIAKAGAESSGLPLFLYLKQFLKKDQEPLKMPIPIFNFINTSSQGAHYANFHEFLIIPASSKHYLESIQLGEIIRKSLKQVIETKYAITIDDYEDDFNVNLSTNKEAFLLLKQAIGNTYVRLGFDVFLGLNSRASALFKDHKYYIKDKFMALSSKDLINYYVELDSANHFLYIEDPLDQDDWEGWSSLYEKLSKTAIIAGSDLIATNINRLQMAIEKKAVNAVVIKPNQAGTVIESLAIAEAAKETGIKVIASHRDGETNDDFISDFAVAVGAEYIKIGSLSRGENIVKYNRLLQIENQLKIL